MKVYIAKSNVRAVWSIRRIVSSRMLSLVTDVGEKSATIAGAFAYVGGGDSRAVVEQALRLSAMSRTRGELIQ